jgi:hypothetical protein
VKSIQVKSKRSVKSWNFCSNCQIAWSIGQVITVPLAGCCVKRVAFRDNRYPWSKANPAECKFAFMAWQY